MHDATTEHDLESLTETATETCMWLHRYISVHNHIFKTSLRHIIPIPGIFKPINYQRHFESLRFIEMELKRLLADVQESPYAANEFAVALHEYGVALLDAIVQLQKMCANLFQKADGTLEYSKADYKRELNEYQKLVVQYQHLGASVNAYFGR